MSNKPSLSSSKPGPSRSTPKFKTPVGFGKGKGPLYSSTAQKKSNENLCSTSRRPSPAPSLNETTIKSKACNASSTLNATQLLNKSVIPPSTDLQWECELAYNEYLQALMKRKIVKKRAEEIKQLVNDQLSLQRESLWKLKEEYLVLNKKVEMATLLEEAEVELKETKDLIDQLKLANSSFDLIKNFDTIKEILQSANNKISLKNVKPPQNQDECDELVMYMKECCEKLVKISKAIGDANNIGRLAELLSRIMQLKTELLEKDKVMTETITQTGENILKKISDGFAAKEEK